MPKPAAFLFYGNDTAASAQAVAAWSRKFEEKYGDATRHVVTPDSGEIHSFELALHDVLAAQSLFADQALIIVRRPTSFEKGRSQPFSKLLAELVRKPLADGRTLVVWVDQDLAATHPLLKAFQKAEADGYARSYRHQTPDSRTLVKQAVAALEGYRVDMDAELYLVSLLDAVAKEQRVRERLKGAEQPLRDERRWWLVNNLETAALAAEKGLITKELLEVVTDKISAAYGPFELVNALEREDYRLARQMIKSWEQAGRSDEFFALFSVLQRFYHPRNRQEGEVLAALLAEIELIIKNTGLPLPALADLFLMKFAHIRKGRPYTPLVNPKRLWQALL